MFTAGTSIVTTPDATPPALPCPVYPGGYTRVSINFIRYMNPSDMTSTGSLCDDDGTSCDISLDICISEVNKQ